MCIYIYLYIYIYISIRNETLPSLFYGGVYLQLRYAKEVENTDGSTFTTQLQSITHLPNCTIVQLHLQLQIYIYCHTYKVHIYIYINIYELHKRAQLYI